MKQPSNCDKFISEVEKAFAVTTDDIKKIIKNFHLEMQRGLAREESSLKMIPSFVYKAAGSEAGRCLALDLGGTNLRVLAVDLDGKGDAKVFAVSKFVVSEGLMRGSGEALFDFIADCIREFLIKNGISLDEKYNLAFTFSFPVEQTGIAAGKLIIWTKGFSATGVEGKDVVVLLHDALKRRGLKFIKVVALANDTVGTLAAKSYVDRSCDMGVILGTGTNACYVEETKGGMIINMEWGNFSKLGLNSYDRELNATSQNPGRQYLEKMVSGMYLGELVRRVIVDAVLNGLISEKLSAEFSEPYSFKTEQMSQVASDNFFFKTPSPLPALSSVEGVGEGLGEGEYTLIKKICGTVSLRSARIAGAAIAAVLTWMDKNLDKKHTVGIDGSLFEKYPGFKENIEEIFSELFGKKSECIGLEMAKDGSGIGAAIIAASMGSSLDLRH